MARPSSRACRNAAVVMLYCCSRSSSEFFNILTIFRLPAAFKNGRNSLQPAYLLPINDQITREATLTAKK